MIHGTGILLLPIGNISDDTIEFLKDALKRVFRRDIIVGSTLPIPDYAFNKERNQYLSTAILTETIEQREFKGYEKILGIFDYDLYVPDLNFVFGEAGRRVAVISLTRLRQEFYNLPENKSLFDKRALTEAVHELGHTYGLGHCRNPNCVMFFSNSLMDTDIKGPDFCPICTNKISINW